MRFVPFAVVSAGDVFIVDCYADDASLQCYCGGNNELRGTNAIAKYWHQTLVEKPAGELTGLQMASNDIVLHCCVQNEIVQATLSFYPDESIQRSRCGPYSKLVAAALPELPPHKRPSSADHGGDLGNAVQAP